MDHMRLQLGTQQHIARESAAQVEQLIADKSRLERQNRDLHANRERIEAEKAQLEQSNRRLLEKEKDYDRVYKLLGETRADVTILRDNCTRQRDKWSEHKKFCPSNEYNKEFHEELVLKMSKAEDELAKSIETLNSVLPQLTGRLGCAPRFSL